MLNLSRHQNNQKSKGYSEKIDLEMPQGQLKQIKPKLPRHISSIESKDYRFSTNQNKTSQMPTACPTNLANDSSEAINLAVSILKYQLQDRASQQKHLENVRRNLQHRLEVAKAEENRKLVTILQAEFRQLETNF